MSEEADDVYYDRREIHSREFQAYSVEQRIYYVPIDEVRYYLISYTLYGVLPIQAQIQFRLEE